MLRPKSEFQRKSRLGLSRSWLLLLLPLGWPTGECAAQVPIKEWALVRITAWANNRVETGSGFFISPNGDVATAYHVIHGAERIDAKVGTKRFYDVTVIAVHPRTDLALLKVPSKSVFSAYYPLPTYSSQLPAGAKVFVHGLPLGFDNQLLGGRLTQNGYLPTQSWVDHTGRNLFRVDKVNLIPLDITAYGGMSGAPVLDAQGRVLGVFSGSLDLGRGYAWAIPVTYLRSSGMINIQRPASQISSWPSFVFMRPGLSLQRSTRLSAQTATVSVRCRLEADKYLVARQGVVKAAHQFNFTHLAVRRSMERIRANTAGESATLRFAKLMKLLGISEPAFEELATALASLQQATAVLAQVCFSHDILYSLNVASIPATYHNVLADKRFGERGEILSRKKFGKTDESQAEAILESVLSINVQLDQKGLTTERKLRFGLRLYDAMKQLADELVSVQEARSTSNVAQYATLLAELLEAVELYDWDRQHRSYTYRHGNRFTITLKNGWLPFDAQLKKATLAQPIPHLDKLRLINFGTLEDHIPRAFAEVYWDASPKYYGGTKTDFGPYWKVVNAQLQQVQWRENITITGVKRYNDKVSNGLRLEAFGNVRTAGGKQLDIYVGYLFSNRGTAAIVCHLTRSGLKWEMCNQLIDSTRFAQ